MPPFARQVAACMHHGQACSTCRLQSDQVPDLRYFLDHVVDRTAVEVVRKHGQVAAARFVEQSMQ